MTEFMKYQHFTANAVRTHVPPIGIDKDLTENTEWHIPQVTLTNTAKGRIIALEAAKRNRDVTYAFTIVPLELKYIRKELRIDADTDAWVAECAATKEHKNGKQ
jgi:hypothetical protein